MLHDYQRRAADFIVNHERCALWKDYGLGKTYPTLTAIKELHDSFSIHRVLIIGPKRVVEHTWLGEIEKWNIDLSSMLISGSPEKRRTTVKHDTSTIHLISRDLVVWLVEEVGKDWPYDMIVIDEASSFKSSSSKRFKALKKVAPHVPRIVELTGSPAPNGLLDLWSQINLLDQGYRLGKTMSGYKFQYFNSDYMGWNWTPKLGAEGQIHSRVADIVLQMSAEDYLQMPDRIDNIVEVHLPDKAAERYEELEKEFILTMDESDDIPILSAAAQVNKMLQLANGAVYTDSDGNWDKVHDAKLDALESIIEESAGQPVLVAYSYQTDLERIKGKFKQAVDIREDGAIEAWNEGAIPLLLCHPLSAGHGLNLQHGGHILVWFGLPWSLESYEQTCARLHRQNQQHPVMIHHIVAAGTADEQVMEALAAKAVTQRDLLNAVRAAI